MTAEKKRVCLIFDERAQNAGAIKAAVGRFEKNGLGVALKEIEKPADATRYASEAAADHFHIVVAVGGDGMLNYVVNGFLQAPRDTISSVGLIPFGTGNDFAGASGIPSGDPAEAADLISFAKPVQIDVGQVNDRYFINMATGGFPAEAAAGTSGISKELLGGFAYLLTGLAQIGGLASKPLHFIGPDFEWEGRSYAFSLGNARTAGGGFRVSPKAVVNDGLLDLMIIPDSEGGIIPLIGDFMRLKRFGDTERFIYVQTPWIDLESDETIHVNIDGEPVKGEQFCFGVHERRLPFRLPDRSPVLFPP